MYKLIIPEEQKKILIEKLSTLYIFDLDQQDIVFISNVYRSLIINISEPTRFTEVMRHVINNFAIKRRINWHHLADQIQNRKKLNECAIEKTKKRLIM
jgi:hypothetical protein